MAQKLTDIERAREALRCLYIAVEEPIARHVAWVCVSAEVTSL